jgi:hypothetical protein
MRAATGDRTALALSILGNVGGLGGGGGGRRRRRVPSGPLYDTLTTFQTDLAPGTAVTAGNSGDGSSGDPVDSVNLSTGATATYENESPWLGELAAVFTSGTANQATTGYGSQPNVLSDQAFFTLAEVSLDALPPDANGTRVLLPVDSLGAFQGDYRVINSGVAQMRDGNGVTLAATSTPGEINGLTFAALAATPFRFAAGVLVYSATVGQLQMRVYTASGALIDQWTSAANVDTLANGGLSTWRAGTCRNLTAYRTRLRMLATRRGSYPVVGPL